MPIAQQDSAPIFIFLPHMYVHNHGNDDHGNKWRWHTSTFKQKPVWISCVKQSKINVTHLSRRNNATLTSDSRHPWDLRRSYFLPNLNPYFLCFVSLIFSFSFFYLTSLSIYNQYANILCAQIERSLLSIITKHVPLLLIGHKCVLGLGSFIVLIDILWYPIQLWIGSWQECLKTSTTKPTMIHKQE